MPLWEVFRPCRTCGSCLWTPMATQNHFPSPPLVSLKKAEQSSSSSLSFPVPDGLPTLSTVAGGGGAVEEWPGRRERATATWLLTFQVFKLNFKTYNENVMNQLSLSHKGGRCKFFFFFFYTTLFLWLEWYIPANLTFVWNRSTESKKVRASRILA